MTGVGEESGCYGVERLGPVADGIPEGGVWEVEGGADLVGANDCLAGDFFFAEEDVELDYCFGFGSSAAAFELGSDGYFGGGERLVDYGLDVEIGQPGLVDLEGDGSPWAASVEVRTPVPSLFWSLVSLLFSN